MYSGSNNNVKCIDSIIQYIVFDPIHYAINMNVISLSIIFSDFNSIFLSHTSNLNQKNYFSLQIFFLKIIKHIAIKF